MLKLNYHHLYYFYITAQQGSISGAAKKLNITPQTISGQISIFEKYVGAELFERRGRRLILNDKGKTTFDFAEQIFSSGEQLLEVFTGNKIQRKKIVVGVTDVVAKVFIFDLFKPLLSDLNDCLIEFKEGHQQQLLAELAINQIDFIIADRPSPVDSNVKAYNHLLGESGISFFASKTLINKSESQFPAILQDQPMIIPSRHSNIHNLIITWLKSNGLGVNIVAEFDDSALMKLFGQQGMGIFSAPSSIKDDICQQYNVQCIGSTTDIKEQYYLITGQRQLTQQIPLQLIESAKKLLDYQ